MQRWLDDQILFSVPLSLCLCVCYTSTLIYILHTHTHTSSRGIYFNFPALFTPVVLILSITFFKKLNRLSSRLSPNTNLNNHTSSQEHISASYHVHKQQSVQKIIWHFFIIDIKDRDTFEGRSSDVIIYFLVFGRIFQVLKFKLRALCMLREILCHLTKSHLWEFSSPTGSFHCQQTIM